MYAIVDIETTGGNPRKDKITEIAIFLHNGKEIVEKYQTLINPEKRIPYFITRLTNITNEMVAEAPKFYEVAKKILNLTEGTTFVAHNSGFDYDFIHHEFKYLGYKYLRKQLCTINLSKKYIPNMPSYGLGNICKELGIKINNRHRAAGDALATVRLFELIMKKANKKILI